MADGETRLDKSGRRPRSSNFDDETETGLRAELEADGLTPDEPGNAQVLSSQPAAMLLKDEPPVSGAGISAGTAPKGKVRIGDRVFGMVTAGSAGFIVALVLLIAVFLLIKAIPAIKNDQVNFLFSNEFSVSRTNLRFGVAGLLYTTVLISVIALVIAVPIAIGIALFITQYAPRRIAKPIGYIIDLLAAIPSIIYGVWGARILAAHLTPVQDFLQHLDFIPLFGSGLETGTVFDGAVVLTVMILPIITAISRDVFDRTPTANKEAAYALGATRWEMIRMAVLPYGRPGVISGAMLGLGRALGETIAVYLILSSVSNFSASMFSGGKTFASLIAGSGDGFGQDPGPYVAAGLVLFVLTFLVNAAARAIVNRRKEFS